MNKSIFTLLLFFLLAAQLSYAQSTIMIVGDSISNGYQIPAGKSWASLLQQCINNMHADVLVVNESRNENTSSSGLQELPESLTAHQPDIVIIALGSNDAKNQQKADMLENNLNQMVTLSMENEAQVILAGSPLSNAQYQQQFSNLAEKHSLIWINDLFADLKPSDRSLQEDGIHATTKSQQKIMNTVWKKLYPILDL